MSSYKNVNSDYTLTCNDGNGVFTVNAQTVFNGNVIYTVPAVTVSPFLTVASNNTGNITDMGLLAQTGPTTYAGLRFDVAANAWQISSQVYSNGAPISTYLNIPTGNALVGGSNTQVQFNDGGSLGASANLTFNKATQTLTLKGPTVLGNTATPSIPSNAVAMYSNAVGGGGTGVFVLSSSVNDELVSKSKAIVYGIIF
jgi:hypothetical protein